MPGVRRPVARSEEEQSSDGFFALGAVPGAESETCLAAVPGTESETCLAAVAQPQDLVAGASANPMIIGKRVAAAPIGIDNVKRQRVPADVDVSGDKEGLLIELPTDMLVLITTKVTVPELLRIAATCKYLWEIIISEDFRCQYRMLRRRSELLGLHGLHGPSGQLWYQPMSLLIPAEDLSLQYFANFIGDWNFSLSDSSDGKVLVYRSRKSYGGKMQTIWFLLDPLHKRHMMLPPPKISSYCLRGVYIEAEDEFSFRVLLVLLDGGPSSRKVKLHCFHSTTSKWVSKRVDANFSMPPRELVRQPNVLVGGSVYMLQHSRRVIEVNCNVGSAGVREINLPDLPPEDSAYSLHTIGRSANNQMALTVVVGWARSIYSWTYTGSSWERLPSWNPQIPRDIVELSIVGLGTSSRILVAKATTWQKNEIYILFDTELHTTRTQSLLRDSAGDDDLLGALVYEMERPPTSGL